MQVAYDGYDVLTENASECAYATVASHYDTLKVFYINRPNYTLIRSYKVCIAIDYIAEAWSKEANERDVDTKNYIRDDPVRFDTLHEASEVINISIRTDAPD